MPRPSPSAVVRLIAKMLTLVTRVSRLSSANVPKTASTVTASGSRADTRLPKAITSSTSVIGTAMLSASARSLPTCPPTSVPRPPPIRTVTAESSTWP